MPLCRCLCATTTKTRGAIIFLWKRLILQASWDVQEDQQQQSRYRLPKHCISSCVLSQRSLKKESRETPFITFLWVCVFCADGMPAVPTPRAPSPAPAVPPAPAPRSMPPPPPPPAAGPPHPVSRPASGIGGGLVKPSSDALQAEIARRASRKSGRKHLALVIRQEYLQALRFPVDHDDTDSCPGLFHRPESQPAQAQSQSQARHHAPVQTPKRVLSRGGSFGGGCGNTQPVVPQTQDFSSELQNALQNSLKRRASKDSLQTPAAGNATP